MKQDSNLMRLAHLSALESGDEVTPLLRKHLSELIEVVAGYLDPWAMAGDLPAVSPRALVVTMAAVVFRGHSFSRIFADSSRIGAPCSVIFRHTWRCGGQGIEAGADERAHSAG